MIFGKIDIGEKPTLELLTECVWRKKLNVSAKMLFEHYDSNGWKNRTGEPLKDLGAVIGIYNSFKSFKRKAGDLREEKHILQNTKDWKSYSQRVHKHYHYECQLCGKKGNLEVHQWHYYFAKSDIMIPACLPWDYAMEDVASLCRKCHEKVQNVHYYSEHEKLSGYK